MHFQFETVCSELLEFIGLNQVCNWTDIKLNWIVCIFGKHNNDIPLCVLLTDSIAHSLSISSNRSIANGFHSSTFHRRIFGIFWWKKNSITRRNFIASILYKHWMYRVARNCHENMTFWSCGKQWNWLSFVVDTQR